MTYQEFYEEIKNFLPDGTFIDPRVTPAGEYIFDVTLDNNQAPRGSEISVVATKNGWMKARWDREVVSLEVAWNVELKRKQELADYINRSINHFKNEDDESHSKEVLYL